LAHYYLGVDGGGTKCRMRLTDVELNTLGEAVTEKPSNLQVREGVAAYEAVSELIGKVYAAADIDLAETARTSACFGMAGARLGSARAAFEARDFPFANLKVFDDIDIARAGAHEGGDGAVLIIGTGSAGLGIMDGKRFQVGGWGFHVGDTMAGAILGRELLRRSLLAHDGLIPSSPLTEAVMSHFNNSPDALMAWSFNGPGIGRPARPADYGEFVPLFFEHFEAGDAVAKDLMQFELLAIDQYVHWFMARGAKSIAIVGGFGRRLMPHITERYGDIIVEPKAEPLAGAVILAKQLFPA